PPLGKAKPGIEQLRPRPPLDSSGRAAMARPSAGSRTVRLDRRRSALLFDFQENARRFRRSTRSSQAPGGNARPPRAWRLPVLLHQLPRIPTRVSTPSRDYLRGSDHPDHSGGLSPPEHSPLLALPFAAGCLDHSRERPLTSKLCPLLPGRGSRRLAKENLMALSLGRFELHEIRDGTFALDGGAMFGVIPKALWFQKNRADEH